MSIIVHHRAKAHAKQQRPDGREAGMEIKQVTRMGAVKNLKKNFTLVEDVEGNLYAIDRDRYPNFENDRPETEYRVHSIDRSGVIDYETSFGFFKKELKEKKEK